MAHVFFGVILASTTQDSTASEFEGAEAITDAAAQKLFPDLWLKYIESSASHNPGGIPCRDDFWQSDEVMKGLTIPGTNYTFRHFADIDGAEVDAIYLNGVYNGSRNSDGDFLVKIPMPSPEDMQRFVDFLREKQIRYQRIGHFLIHYA